MDPYSINIIATLAIVFFSLAIIYVLHKIHVINLSFLSDKPDDPSSLHSEIEKLKLQNQELLKKNQDLEFKLNSVGKKNKIVQATSVELDNHSKKLTLNKENLSKLKSQKEKMIQVVHDIKNPASAIHNFVTLLESYELNSEEQAEVLEMLTRTSARLVQLSEEMTKIISSEISDFELNIHPCNLNVITQNVYDSFKVAAENKNMELTIQKDSSIPLAPMDENKIEEAIENLVDNAIKYSLRNSVIQITTNFANDKNVEVNVIDSGPGISSIDLKRIFEKGTRTANEPTGGEKTTGIGLWIVKTIVEGHGGRVTAKSRGNGGSIFTISLPVKN